LISVLIALSGIGAGWWIFARRPLLQMPRILENKYYVDEIYDASIVQPIRVVSEQGLWRGFDVRVIDGAVNGTGALVAGSSAVLRRLQTGSVRTYAGSLFLGVVFVLGYYLWR
jgi:NADH-quinone oxidoreductase subunit L